MKISNINIGQKHTPFVIAEMSANHNGNIENAFAILRASKDAGASAVKMQSYTPDTITLNSKRDEFLIKEGLWKGRYLYDLYKEAHMPWSWHQPLFEYAKELDVILFSSPFDKSAIDLLEKYNAPAYKIASYEAIDLPLIEYAAQTKKPMIISTGMASFSEITDAYETARNAGCEHLALLHCVSGYPSSHKDANLRTISDLKVKFDCPIGLSDHTLDHTTSIASIALGASIIEKHITLDNQGGGPDDSFSLEPKDFAQLVQQANDCWFSLGQVNYKLKGPENQQIDFRRSLYFVTPMSKGDIITEQNVRSVRPGSGLAPKHTKDIMGKKVLRDIDKHEPVTKDVVEL